LEDTVFGHNLTADCLIFSLKVLQDGTKSDNNHDQISQILNTENTEWWMIAILKNRHITILQ